MKEYNSPLKWEIEVYVNERGQAPFQNWLTKLDYTIQARILDRLNRLRDGDFGDYKSLPGSLNELRFHFGSGYRVYYGIIENRIVLLLCGGDKKSQAKDFKKAKRYWDDYKENLP